jgi:predicted TIM-barrel fold metal-dependent hydrolase
MRHHFSLLLTAALGLSCAILLRPAAQPDNALATFSEADLHAFAALAPIDTHAHVFPSDPRFYGFLRKLDMHLLDIVVATKDNGAFPNLEAQINAAKTFVRDSHGQATLCTTFDPFAYSNPDFAANAVRRLNRDFADGAVAVKIWKNVGMQLKDQAGNFVMPDDPRLEPIYKDIAANNKTLIAHLAEPDSCWLPPDPSSPDFHYYSQHPEWYMFKQPDHPGKMTIIKARDHMLDENPSLRVVGAHLGSLERDLDGLGRRFDRYANFAVDVAARTVYLTIAPRDKVRRFLIKYQDRVLYGTDLAFRPPEDGAAASKTWEDRYALDWAFYSSDKTITYRGRQVKGLALPAGVLRKLYHDNAVHWIPGVVPNVQ